VSLSKVKGFSVYIPHIIFHLTNVATQTFWANKLSHVSQKWYCLPVNNHWHSNYSCSQLKVTLTTMWKRLTRYNDAICNYQAFFGTTTRSLFDMLKL